MLTENVLVYNFVVEDWHTYFVGGDRIWVHNAKKMPCGNVGNTTKGVGKATDVKFPKTNADAKKIFGVDLRIYHQKIKKEILDQIKKDPIYGKEFRKMGQNPDIGVDPSGKIVL